MNVQPTTFTIAEYCGQMKTKSIIINADYQRSSKIWPSQAQSFLIDTILSGYPIPKLTLSQTTDLKTRQTIKEIVDGQQRSQSILHFFNDTLRLAKNVGEHRGLIFSQLEEEKRQAFAAYPLGVDLLVGASPAEIREVFRRMNSYTVPLNHQERRHAVWQGEFKWFAMRISQKYAQLLKNIGVMTERGISRMDDTQLLSEIILAHQHGIDWSSQPKIDAFYKEHDVFFDGASYEALIDKAFARIIDLGIQGGALATLYNFYSIMLAIMAVENPTSPLEAVFECKGKSFATKDRISTNLTDLASSIEGDGYQDLAEFVAACVSTTSKKLQRTTRHRWFCRALTEQSIRAQ